MAETESKKLAELRVVDLKHELEKRNIDASGVKAILFKKLHKALMDEKVDPETHLFQIEVDSKGTPIKKKKEESEEESAKDENTAENAECKKEEIEAVKDEKDGKASDDVATEAKEANAEPEKSKTDDKKEDPVVKINGNPEDGDKKPPAEDSKTTEDIPEVQSKKKEIPEENKPDAKTLEEEKEDAKEEEADPAEDQDDQEQDHEPDDEPAEKTASKEPDEDDGLKIEDKNDANGMIDAEESIHLTIGEDEEKFMAGEDEPADPSKDSEEEPRSGGRGSKTAEQRKNNRSISPESAHDDKDKKSNYRNLWVSGLAAITRAQDLKQIFSKLGKVVAAKVVTNAKTPGARCYGFVTMATAEDAQACIKGLNLTELHGKLISVEAVANKPASGNAKKPEEKRKASPAPAAEEKKLKREDTKTKITINFQSVDDKKVDEKSGPEESAKKKEEEAERPKTANSDRSGRKSGSPVRRSRPPIRERLGERPVVASRNRNRETRPARPTSSKRSDVLSFSHIKEEHDRRRQREKERAAREEERRRREEVARQRSIELRQKEEMMRLEREREKVRLERLKLQKEKQELLRIERERLEREKEELRKAQLKLEEEKRAKRVAREVYEERKRSDSSRRYDPVGPPPRKEVRRDASPPHARRYEESSRTRRDELPPPPRVKETLRYPEKTSSSSIRPGREDRSDRREERRERARDEPLRKESSRMHREDRYDPPPPPKPDLRYGSESWTGGKPYPSSGSRPDAPSWMSSDRKSDANPWGRSVPSQSDRWPVSGSSGMVSSSRSGMYGGSLNLAGGLSHPGSGMSLSGMSGMYPASDRYDAYKPGSMGRKY